MSVSTIEVMECAACHKQGPSKTRCVNGHCLCSDCHTQGMDSIGKAGGPRCCKRDSWLAILAAADFAREHPGAEMERTVPVCSYSSRNKRIGKRRPFPAANHKKPKVAFRCVHNSCRSQMAEALRKSWPSMSLRAFPPAPNPTPKSTPTRYA